MPEAAAGSAKATERQEDYSLYIVRCRDRSLYTGIARDVQSRIAQHESGVRGAKYLNGRSPLTLVFEQRVGTRSRAQQLEFKVKRLSRAKKLALVAGRLTLEKLGAAQISGSSRG